MAKNILEEKTMTQEELTVYMADENVPKYKRNREYNKVFNRTLMMDDEEKIICEKIIAFDETPRQLWLKFSTMEDYTQKERVILDMLRSSDGGNEVVIYISETKQMKMLGRNYSVNADAQLVETIGQYLGEENVKIVEKNIEKMC